MGRRLVLLPLLGLLALGYATKCPKQRTSPGREILCYTTTTNVKLLEVSICRCTTLVHQGHDLKDLSTLGIEEFQKSLKEINPILQVVLSVSDVDGSLKTSARIRQEAAARIVRVLNEVDGIELNVTAGTKERLVHFVQGLKTELTRKSKDKRILLVLPTRPDDLAKQFDIKALSKYVDLFTLPTHYLVDDEEAFRTFHPSRLMGLFDMLNTDSLVDLVSGLGAEKKKILVSLPVGVYKFALERNDENAPRAAAKEKLPVQISRSEMCEIMDNGEWIIERDEDLTAPYAFKEDTWIAFEDKISVGIKGKYVLLRDLAGLGIHNVEKDSKSKCGNSLTEDVYHSFTDNKRKTREAVLTSLQEDLQPQTQSPNTDHIKSSGFRIVRVVDTDGHIHAMRENTQTEFSCPRQGYFVHPKSCNRFYRCVKFNQGVEDYSVFEFDCPAGLAFDESTEVCVWPGTISACSGSSEIAPSNGAKFTCPDHPGYYADPQNCRFFYACFDLGEHELTAYEFRCPYGLVFDEKKLICEWPYLVPSCGGGTYERHDYGGSGHGGSNQGGHGVVDQSGHGGYGGANQGEHSGHGGTDQGRHGGYGGMDEGGHGGSNEGGHREIDQSGHGGYGGANQGEHNGHGGMDQGKHGGYGGMDQGGHGGSNEDGHREVDQSGHGGYGGGNQGEHRGHGGTDQGGHGEYGGTDQGGYGDSNKGGHGVVDQSGHGGYGGANQGEHNGHGGMDQGKHGGYGGMDQGGHGGSNEGGHGVVDQSGHGGYDGANQGEHNGHGGYGGMDQGGHGGSNEGGHREVDQGGHGEYGGTDQGGHGEYGGTDQGGYGGSNKGGHGVVDQSGHGGYGGADQSGHGGANQNGHGGLNQGKHGGSNQGGHGGADLGGHGESGEGESGGTNYDEYGGSSQGGYGSNGQTTIYSEAGESSAHVTPQSGHGESSQGGSSQGEHEGPNHSQHGGSSESGHTVSYATQGGYTSSSQDNYNAGGAKGAYTTSTLDGYTKIEPKYPATTKIGYSPAPGIGSITNAGGYSGQSSTVSGNSRHQTSAINAGFTTIDTGVHTGIFSGGYGGHTETIRYGGQSTPAVTYEIEETTSHGGYAASGNTETTSYHDKFGSTGSQGDYERSSYTDSSPGFFPGIKTGLYGNSQGASSASTTTHHGNFGSSGYTAGDSTGGISSGAAIQGVIRTGDSTSGIVYTHNDVPGTIVSGRDEQGGIITGITQPGYVQTQSGTPGYVINNGVKTIYRDSASKNTFAQGIPGNGAIITGAPASKVVLTGNSSPGTYLAGQTSPGVIIGGGVTPGVSISDSASGEYYTRGSGTSIYNGAAGSRGQTIFTSASKTPNYRNNPFLGQTSPAVIVGSGVTSDASFGSMDGKYYTGGSGASVYNGATGSRGHITFTSASNSPDFPKNHFTTVNGDLGYKTNEYHDNGGRGTIRYNNGEITHKFTEDDVRDHRTQFGTYPTFDVKSYEASTANKGSFTKTGPTKTGIVTAQVGGSGTYVAGSMRPRPFSGTQNIGANAFGSGGTTTNAPDLVYSMQSADYDAGSIDVSKINLASTSKEVSSGYSYTKPAVQLNTFGVTDSIKAALSSVKKTSGFPTSSAPFLDVHVYNSPSVVTSAPIAESPAVVNTYTYNKPSSVQYEQTVYQSTNSPSSFGAVSTGTYSRPIVSEQRKFPSVSSIVAPIAFTTGPLENFKTTVFEAARIPASVSTVQPVIDTGYQTVVSTTPFSVGVNSNGFGYSRNTGYQSNSLSTKGNSAIDINVSFQQPDFSTKGQYDNGDTAAPAIIGSSGYYSTSKSRRPSVTQSVTYKRPNVQQVTYESNGSSVYSKSNDYDKYSHTQTGETFGQRVSVTPTVNYATPTVVTPPQIYNVPSSTIAPAIGVTYREPFQIDQSTARPISQSRIPFEGYTYSKPFVKFVTSTVPSISYKQEGSYDSKTTKSGGSPTNLDISRTEVEKLITNYNRGSTKYTPSDYENYNDNTGNRYDETLSNNNRYSGQQSYSSTKISSDGKSQSGGYSRIYSTTPSYESNADTLNFGGRVSNLGVTVQTGADRKEPSTTYSPVSSLPSPGRKVSSSSRRPPFYSVTTPAVTTYSGGYNRGPSTLSYETSDTGVSKPKGKGKVIVKFSDLHPLLLGKLGAECTCKADPFATFRGSKPLPINSSKGLVDLRNYDESDVYVDLEASKEKGDYDSAEYNTYLEASTPANYDDGRYETPVVAIFDGVTPSTKEASKLRRPSSNYRSGSSSSTYLLPVSSTSRTPTSTYLPAASSTKRSFSSTYLPPISSTYLPSAVSRGGASFHHNHESISASLTSSRGGGFRAGKNLGESNTPTRNTLTGQGAAFDRYGPGGLRGIDETLQGTSDCARPGLFRHPNFCNKFYACHWDEWKKTFTLHVFNCPVHLTFDNSASACNWPSKGPACQDDNLLV